MGQNIALITDCNAFITELLIISLNVYIMKYFERIILLFTLGIFPPVVWCSAYDNLNLFIGTGGPGYGYGGLNPGATMPLGSLRLGPDTASTIVDISYRHFSGYHYLDDHIRAFSHTHLVGAGVYDLGNIGVMPIRLSIDRNMSGSSIDSIMKIQRDAWWSTFNKSTESASPGLYSVYLDEPQVLVKLLAISTQAAVHSYVWDKQSIDDSHVSLPSFVIDVCHAAKLQFDIEDDSRCENATISVTENTFKASVQYHGKLSGRRWHYLYGKLSSQSGVIANSKWSICTDKAIDSCKMYSSNEVVSVSSVSGVLYAVGALLEYSIAESLEVFVGYSRISIEQAESNLLSVISNDESLWYFDPLQKQTQTKWCSYLSRFQVEAMDGDDDIEIMLKTAYYHTLTSVTDYTESGDLYLGVDNVVHNVTADRLTMYGRSSNIQASDLNEYQYRFFSDFSLWDTFRTLHPWLLLTNEDLSVGIARSMSDITSQQNAFPRWMLANNEASCMIGESGSSFIVDMVLSDLSSLFDLEVIANALLLQSTQNVPTDGRNDVDYYMQKGYVSSESSSTSTSLTLTYAYDDYLLSVLLSAIGDQENSEAALNRSSNYKNVWSNDDLIFCPKSSASGELSCPKNAALGPDSWAHFVEGNALHWKWFVPHDIPGLIDLHPSEQYFNDDLENYFKNHIEYQERFGSAAPNPYYWAGNEHSYLVPWLFNYGPDCTNTQYWTRNITQLHFSNSPHGLPGNDDYGSMSSFLLFTSLGLFPEAGLARFHIGSPRVKSASIFLRRYFMDDSSSDSTDAELTIFTYNNSANNLYVKKLYVNGVEWTQGPFIERSALLAEKRMTLEFYMHDVKTSSLC